MGIGPQALRSIQDVSGRRDAKNCAQGDAVQRRILRGPSVNITEESHAGEVLNCDEYCDQGRCGGQRRQNPFSSVAINRNRRRNERDGHRSKIMAQRGEGQPPIDAERTNDWSPKRGCGALPDWMSPCQLHRQHLDQDPGRGKTRCNRERANEPPQIGAFVSPKGESDYRAGESSHGGYNARSEGPPHDENRRACVDQENEYDESGVHKWSVSSFFLAPILQSLWTPGACRQVALNPADFAVSLSPQRLSGS